ncbi:MAG: hypothetical protein QOE96_207 [Blastocatellia bacterium]|jgi:hypothetical protein|nr:hypothetical protein [Blastocatellia bacterium]
MELPEELAEQELFEAHIAVDPSQPIDEAGADPASLEEQHNEDEAIGDEEGEADIPAEQVAEADQAEEEDQEEERPGEKRLKVFISYNRNDNDGAIADRIYDELSQQYDVFLDRRTIKIGESYEKVTEDWLDTSDFVIALISAKSVETSFIKAELQRAYERYKTEARPTVIPLRINYAGPSGLRLDAYIGHFQRIDWDNRNFDWLLRQLHAGLSNKLAAITKAVITGTDIIPISDTLRERYAQAFVEPRELISTPVSFDEKRLLWISGDAAVTNYVALSIAATITDKSLYEITKQRKWSEINSTLISDSTIVLRDALPASYLQESGAIGEWHALRAIIERNNIIIATAPNDEFEKLEQELLRYQFTDYQHRQVDAGSYSDDSKLLIFSRLIEHLFKTGELDEDKYAWATDLVKDPNETDSVGGQGRARAIERRRRDMRKKFRENLGRWSPADIVRFVLSLSQVDSESDITRLLQRSAAIEDEIRSWFLALDDSTRCFVMTVALFANLDHQELWEYYKSIVEHLRHLDANLRLLPFGICRKRAHPYVSLDGPIALDERVADAVRQEIARSYREYFVELTPKLKDWSVPPGRSPKTIEQRNQRKPRIEETREARMAIARMVGIAARLGLDDLTEILDYWATDSNIQIRKSVAFAFAETAKSPTGVNYALNLLERWSLDINSHGQTRWRALAAAHALGFVTAAANDAYVTVRALHCLRTFARSRRQDARFYASIAVRQVARYAPLSSTEGALGRLAKDDRTEVRLNVAAALNEARAYDADTADALIERWVLSDDPNLRWVALCGIVTSRKSQNGTSPKKYERLLDFLDSEESALSLASVLSETVTDDHYGQVAKDSLGFLAEHAKEAQWTNFAAGLAIVSTSKLDKEILPLLRFSDGPPFEERAVDVRREVLRRKLGSPARFLATLRAWLNGKDTQLELFRALTQLLDVTPDSSRSEVIAAMAEQFCAEPASVNETLSALRILAPAHFETLAQGVRNEAFRRSLEDSAGFVALAGAQLAHVETADDTAEAIVRLARDDPPGSREQMMRALLEADEQAPQMTKNLVVILRTGEPDLVRIVYEFNYRLIEKAMTVPVTFPAFVLETVRTDDDAISLLNYLAEPEPQGNRSTLVRTLVEARLLEANGVDKLLALPALKQWTNLASLQAEVARSYYLRRIFAPRFVTKLFSKRSIENW